MDRVEGESMTHTKECDAARAAYREGVEKGKSEALAKVKQAIQKTLRKKGKCYCVFCLSQGQYGKDCVVTELESLLTGSEEVKA